MCKSLSILLLALLITGCQTAPSGDPSLYDALGKRTGIATFVKDTLYRVVEDPRIAATFKGVDIAQLHRHLTDQICALADGPCTYTGRSMAEAHAGLGLNETHFNALVEDLILAMEDNQVPVSAQNRLLALLAPLHDDVIDQPALTGAPQSAN